MISVVLERLEVDLLTCAESVLQGRIGMVGVSKPRKSVPAFVHPVFLVDMLRNHSWNDNLLSIVRLK
jgi:hypothetical protein